MIEEILPRGAAAVATRRDFDAPLYPEEEEAIRSAVESRRREFTTARACARAALMQLGLPSQAIGVGPRGDPRWPAGVVGSITHCRGYRAAAVGRTEDFLAIGIDAETNEELPDGLLDVIATPLELAWLRRWPAAADVSWGRLLFSIKESVYKVCNPYAPGALGFEDATIVVDPERRTFSARLSMAVGRPDGFPGTVLPGRWSVRDRLVLTAIALMTPSSELCNGPNRHTVDT